MRGGCESAAVGAGTSWAKLSRRRKVKTSQLGAQGCQVRTLGAQTGRPKRTALGIHTGLGHCAPYLLRSGMAPNKRFLPRPGPGAGIGQIANSLYTETRPASRVTFCASALGSRSERQERRALGECVRAAACAETAGQGRAVGVRWTLPMWTQPGCFSVRKIKCLPSITPKTIPLRLR